MPPTPFTNHPRTLVVHFDGVRDCAWIDQADGKKAITVDFLPTPTSPTATTSRSEAELSPAEKASIKRKQLREEQRRKKPAAPTTSFMF